MLKLPPPKPAQRFGKDCPGQPGQILATWSGRAASTVSSRYLVGDNCSRLPARTPGAANGRSPAADAQRTALRCFATAPGQDLVARRWEQPRRRTIRQPAGLVCGVVSRQAHVRVNNVVVGLGAVGLAVVLLMALAGQFLSAVSDRTGSEELKRQGRGLTMWAIYLFLALLGLAAVLGLLQTLSGGLMRGLEPG